MIKYKELWLIYSIVIIFTEIGIIFLFGGEMQYRVITYWFVTFPFLIFIAGLTSLWIVLSQKQEEDAI